MDPRGTSSSDDDQMVMGEGGNGNFHGSFASSSIAQASLEGDNPTPTLENLNSDASEDEFPELEVEDQGNNPDLNQVAEESADSILRKRKRHHRHTQLQIREMESFYRRFPRPNKNQRQDLARQLGLEPLQVKFWFQNRRTQSKAQNERRENNQLRAENGRLRLENMQLKQNTIVTSCNSCGGPRFVAMSPEQRMLTLENAQLTKEFERVAAMAKNAFINIRQSSLCSYTPSSLLAAFEGLQANIPSQDASYRSQPVSFPNGPGELNKSVVTELAILAMKEITTMAQIGEPLWILNDARDNLVLNEPEYFKLFRKGFTSRPLGLKSEASRETSIVMMEWSKILEIFMELNKWLAVFSGIISRAMLLEVLATGAAGSYDGAMKVMSAEFQVLSPVVPTRECVFVRYCKQVTEGTWAVVDVSADALIRKGAVGRCQRRPSGCIIQAMPNGYTKITWVEHVEIHDQMIHHLSKSFISSGYAYGAKRWISILERQCERIASASGLTNYSYYGYLNGISLESPEGRQSILKLSERMVLSFCGGVTAPFSSYPWKIVSGDGFEKARIMMRKTIDDPGRPGGVVLSASICFWIPVLPKTVFKFLRSERTRAEWDVLTKGGGVQEIACINNGKETGNCVTILRVTNPQADQGNMIILQESSTEPTTSFVVYAPVDLISIGTVFTGGNSDEVQLLPSGFTILPSGPPDCGIGSNDNANVTGTLLTVSFQILVDAGPYAKLSVAAVDMVNNLVQSTSKKIKTALGVHVA